VADPQTLYDRPVNLFVGGFIGSPAMNMLEASLAREGDRLVVKAGSQSISLDAETLDQHPALRDHEGRGVVLGIRPEDLEDAQLATETPPEHRLHGQVELTEALGSEIMVHFSVDAPPALTEDVRELAQDVGDNRIDEGAAHSTLVGRFGARSRVRVGDTIEIAVDTRALHFFDPESGLGIYQAGSTTKGAGA
jgi:multiple sugar transport system ATP-binding protein